MSTMEKNNNVCKKYSKKHFTSELSSNGLFIYPLTILVSMLCYLNSLDGDFVHDDILAIKTNADVTRKSSIASLLTHDFWGNSISDPSSHKSYRPLSIWTFRINYILDGLNPYGYHLTNVILHGLVTGLFTHMCMSVFYMSKRGTLVAGLLFAVHPIHTEAVSGIVGRADILAGGLFLLSFLAYYRSLDHTDPASVPATKHRRLFGLSLVLAVCAMLTKEHGITVLGVCVLYDVIVCSQQSILRILKEKKINAGCAPLMKRLLTVCVVVFLGLVFRLWINGGELPTFQEGDNPASFSPTWVTRFLSYNYLLYFNTKLLFAPITLSYDWQMGSIPPVQSLWDVRNLCTLGFYSGMLLVIWAALFKMPSKRTSNPVLGGVLLLVIPFMPATNLFFRVGFVVAERLLYTPSMGQCILVALGYTRLVRRFPGLRWLLNSVVCLVLSVMVMKTLTRNQVWLSRETLFRSGLESVPNNAKVYFNYANYLKDEGYTDLAIQHSKKAIELYSNYVTAWNNLGTLMTELGEAERCYREALRLSPNHIPALINLGSLLFQQGKTGDGLEILRKAERVEPHNAKVCVMLGSMFAHLGQTREASEYFRKAIHEKPDFPDAYNNYGAFLQQMGHYSEAVDNYRKAFLLDVGHVDAMTNAAQSLRHLGRINEAEILLKRALDLRPSAMTLDQLGKFYLHSGRHHEALVIYKDIEDKLLNNSDTTGLLNYVKVLAETKDLTNAQRVLDRLLQVIPNDVEVLHQMSSIHGLLGQHSQGLVYVDQAVSIMDHSNDRRVLSKLHFARASHLKDLKRYEEALEAYLDSLALNDDQPKAHVNVGAIYHMKHDLHSAQLHYTETLRLDPSNRIAHENLEKLAKRVNKKKGQKPG